MLPEIAYDPLFGYKHLHLFPEDIKIPALVKAELLYGAAKSARQEEHKITFSAGLKPWATLATL